MTCKKTQGFLETIGSEIGTKEDASKVKYDSAKALRLLDGIDTLVAMKGKKVVVFDLRKTRPGDEVLLAHLIGPTGNLRAPTARIGRKLLVGFNEETYKELVGS